MEAFGKYRTHRLHLEKEILQTHNKPLKVLHVDSDKSFLEVTKGILKMLGNFEIDFAQSESEAYKALSTKQYDVIVSDGYLNGVNGLQFFYQLREKGVNLPFVLFTINEEIAKQAAETDIQFIGKYGDPEKVFTQLCETIKAGCSK